MSTTADKIHTQPVIDETNAATATAPGEPSPESPNDGSVREPQDLNPGEPEPSSDDGIDHSMDAPGRSRDDIYQHARNLRNAEVGPDIDQLDPIQQKQVRSMELMAKGIDPEEVEAQEKSDALAKAMEAEAAGATEITEQEIPPVEPIGVDKSSETVNLTVYGQQVAVTPEQVKEAGGEAALQKQLGAAIKYSRVATYEAQLRKFDESLTQRERMLSQGLDQNGRPLPPPSEVTGPSQPPAGAEDGITEQEIETLAKEFSDGIFSASQTEAEEKVRSVISKVMRGRGPSATPTKEELVGETVAALRQSGLLTVPDDPAEVARQEANAMFREDYKEFQEDTDPIAFRTVQSEISEVSRSPVMSGRPLVEIVRMAAERVRRRFSGASVESLDFSMESGEIDSAREPRLESTSIPGRLILKERTVIPPTQAGQRNEVPPETSPKQSNRAYIEQMRKSRGQAV